MNDTLSLKAAAGTKYPPAAFRLVLDAVRQILGAAQTTRHISPHHLTCGFGGFAVARFGPLAPTVLSELGLHDSLDLGVVVYRLIELDALKKGKRDRLAHFAAPKARQALECLPEIAATVLDEELRALWGGKSDAKRRMDAESA